MYESGNVYRVKRLRICIQDNVRRRGVIKYEERSDVNIRTEQY